jgi:nitroreductase
MSLNFISLIVRYLPRSARYRILRRRKYIVPDSVKPENAQNQINFLKRLRAVRQFRPDPVPQEVVNAVLVVARWSGSASNRQPWEFVVIRNKETLRALSAVEGYASHLAGASLGIVLVMAGDHGQVEQETFDEGRLSERIMLAAAAYGVGSSIGWFKRSGMTDAKALLGIPQERLVRTAISLGYPDEEARRARPRHAQARKPLSDIVHDERYGLHQHHQK